MAFFILYFSVILVSYLIGSFPTGVVLSRLKYRIDVREMGSGNMGATNMARVYGWYAGALTLVIDFLKGFVPLLVLLVWKGEMPWLVVCSGIAVVMGHCFSLYLRFKGGKGVATSLGCVTAVLPGAALCAVIAYGIIVALTRVSAVGSLGGLAVSLLYLVFRPTSLPNLVLVAFLSLMVLLRHHSNIRKLWKNYRDKSKLDTYAD